MKSVFAICAVFLLSFPAAAGTESDIAALLNEFLAKVDDPAMHDRFWSDDLVYVSAAGVVKTKADILASMRAGDTPGTRDRKRDEPKASFSAEEVKVRPLSADVALLNFRLVQHAGAETNHFRNSGTFVRRNGRWQAVSWQATREKTDPAAR
jgi:hypothetical protein